ncbi:hypothetical protein TNCV_3812701 [Trichonephila clavipes]|nr:hypothetical protein TNCV_3812701 [Trichonephila clavipes]
MPLSRIQNTTFVMPNITDYPDMGLRTVLTVRMPKVSDRGLPCHKFEPSTTKDPPCKAAMHNLLRAETSSRWCGVVVRRGGVPAQVSSTSLDHGSKLRGPSPKTLV